MNARALLPVLFCLMIAGLVSLSAAQFDYNSVWKDIDQLRSKGLPESMLVKVDSLYTAAKAENKTDQQIKALLYKLEYLRSKQEFDQIKAIEKVKAELSTATEPVASILHSLLAHLYWNYYASNRYRYSQRTTISNVIPEDVATWDPRTITIESLKEFQLSLKHAKLLQDVPIDDLPAIVESGGPVERQLRPTLYDLLAHIALDFYKNAESGLTLPFEEFTIADARYLGDVDTFCAFAVTSPDSLSLKFMAIRLFQDLLSFHRGDKTPEGLIEVDLERLSWVFSQSKHPDGRRLYEDALKRMELRYTDDPASAYISYFLASSYVGLGNLYDPEISEDKRWEYRHAVQICDATIAKYPKSYGASMCRALKDDLIYPSLNVSLEDVVPPNTPIKAMLGVKNLSGATLRFYKISSWEWDYFRGDYQVRRQYQNMNEIYAQLKGREMRTQVVNPTNEGDLREHKYEIPLQGFEPGFYLMFATSLGDDSFKEGLIIGNAYFTVSAISHVTSSAYSGELMLLDRISGQPLSGVNVVEIGYRYLGNEQKYETSIVWTGISDIDGMIRVPVQDRRDRYYRLIFSVGADSLLSTNFYPGEAYLNRQRNDVTLLFTDRAIYRPGQTIYVKGIHYNTDHQKDYKLVPKQNMQVYLRDANRKEIARKDISTNGYGTFETSFTAPKNVLLGRMTIETYGGSVSFNVEEYKRPRFEVSLEKPKTTYKLNQTVTVKGTALTYSGFPVDNANVTYRVSRIPVYPRWCWWWGIQPQTEEKEIAQGIGQTDDKGEIRISFLAVGDPAVLRKYNPYFSYKISLDVSDLNGETRSGTLTLSIGEKELLLDPDVPEYVDLSTARLVIPIKTTNLGGEHISAQGKVTISRLQTPDHVLRSRLWDAPDRDYLTRDEFKSLFPHDIYGKEDQMAEWKTTAMVFSRKFNTFDADSLVVRGFSRWKPGAYKLEAVSTYKGQKVTETRYFTVYASKSNALPYPMAEWFVPVKTVCEPGEEAQILIGSGYSGVSVLFEIERDYKIVSRERFSLTNAQRLLRIPVLEEDRGGFFVYLTFTRDGRLYTRMVTITVPWTNKQISWEYMTFRDKLLPGQTEEWRLKLKDHTGGKITAEVLASMYDASLDAFLPSVWSTNIFGTMYRYRGWVNKPISGEIGLSLENHFSPHGFAYRQYPDFNWSRYGMYRNYNSGGYAQPGVKVAKDRVGSSRQIEMNELSDSMVYEQAISQIGDIYSTSAGVTTIGDSRVVNFEPYLEPKADLSTVKARTNFAETAFFYPRLLTDENGELSFSFTVPESLTKWKFRALAVTKDLKIGTTENSSVTQKPLMVMPNAPRFFREGDKITLSAKISSLDEGEHRGEGRLYLFDALNMTPIDSLFSLINAQQPFSVSKGGSAVLSWDLDIPYGISAVTYRVVASSGDFSDGEENTIPILSNRMLVTESLPLPVSGNSSKSFVFRKLLHSGDSDTLRHHKLTLEFTSNPAWYAVQALPYLMEYPYECNEQTFSRLYANALASHIANSDPRIKRVFESWKNTPNSQALLSNLEKNQELKAVMLQETPWVFDGENESQSKQRIGLLFDLNRMANEYDMAITKLKRNQSSSGAWPWFQGGYDSWWITQYIVEGFGHLDHLKVKSIRNNATVWQMVRSAVAYIDREILRDYQEIMKNPYPELDHLGYLEMHYLYARSFFPDILIPLESQIAVNYFREQADKYWLNKDIYGQGLIALARHRDKNTTTPGLILASLKERALHDEEMGMWWKDNSGGWYWYQAPIETQALMIEVFSELSGNPAHIDELRTWLLKRKQTTNWKTTKATAEACYALLLEGTEWLASDKLATIRMNNVVIDPKKIDGVTPEAGTGYFKTSWSGKEIVPEMANISVTNPNPVPAWGALYWQYFEDLDKITPAETPLKLKKEVFVERMTPTGKVLEPVLNNGDLKIGDKVIVRIELRVDRDMEYVHMKDMRSAGFEPINVLSRYKWQDGLGYYESTGDAATNFFIDYLRKGTYVFEYPLRVFNQGDFSNGITTIQCMYAPEYTSHSEGIRVKVK